MGCQFGSLGEQAAICHMARVQPPMFESSPRVLQCMSSPLSLPVSLSVYLHWCAIYLRQKMINNNNKINTIA